MFSNVGSLSQPVTDIILLAPGKDSELTPIASKTPLSHVEELLERTLRCFRDLSACTKVSGLEIKASSLLRDSSATIFTSVDASPGGNPLPHKPCFTVRWERANGSPQLVITASSYSESVRGSDFGDDVKSMVDSLITRDNAKWRARLDREKANQEKLRQDQEVAKERINKIQKNTPDVKSI